MRLDYSHPRALQHLDNDIACEPDCRWTGKGYRGRSCRTDVLEELEHI
jgi:hypothetical protein